MQEEVIVLSSEDEQEEKKVDITSKPQKKTKIKVWRKDER
jgi:hypothetical protein